MHWSHDKQQQRQQLLETAAKLLQSEGPNGLSLRRVSQDAGMSTQMIYTLFGGKDGLIMALYEVSFERLAQQLNAVPYESDPLLYLKSLAYAMRQFAHDQPMFYEMMFGRTLPHFTPLMADHMRQSSAYQLLLQTVQASSAQYGHQCIHTMTDALWLSIHGALCMELSGFFMDEDQAHSRFNAMIDALLEGFKHTDNTKDTQPMEGLGIFGL